MNTGPTLSGSELGGSSASEVRPQRIQLSRAKGWRMPSNTVKVDRSTRWGNPFIYSDSDPVRLAYYADYRKNVELWMGWPVADVDTAVRAFREMCAPDMAVAARRLLRGKNLACWCPIGSPCHADVLLDLANAASIGGVTHLGERG